MDFVGCEWEKGSWGKNHERFEGLCTSVLKCVPGQIDCWAWSVESWCIARSLDILTRLYRGLVRPHLEYCVSDWSLHYVKYWKRVQNRFTRIEVEGLGLEYGVRLERLKLMTLEERTNHSDLVEVFKISKGLSAIPWSLFFRVDNYKRTSGHSKKLVKESFKLDIRKHFFSQRVVNRWNSRVRRWFRQERLIRLRRDWRSSECWRRLFNGLMFPSPKPLWFGLTR